jgi:hypothetical protein
MNKVHKQFGVWDLAKFLAMAEKYRITTFSKFQLCYYGNEITRCYLELLVRGLNFTDDWNFVSCKRCLKYR